MKSTNDLWEAIGAINEEEAHHVLTKLFDMYERALEKDPENNEVLLFFRNLDTALTLTTECNLNRR